MSNEVKFVDGMRVYAPRDNAPSFVKANIVLNVEELQGWLSGRSGEVRIDIKESKGGKYYASENDYKPRENGPAQSAQQRERPSREPAGGGFEDDPSDIPF